MSHQSKKNIKTVVFSLALLLSLALNVGLLSLMAGRHAGTLSEFRRARIENFMEMARTLPVENRQAALDAVKKRGPELKAAIEDIKQQRKSIRALLEKDDVDTKALQDAFSELKKRTATAQDAGFSMMMNILPHIPPEQRRALIEKQAKSLQ